MKISPGLPVLLALLVSPGFSAPQQQSAPSPATLDYESPPDAPFAGIIPCVHRRPGPEGVYLHSGEFHETVEDLRIPGRGFDFRWVRKYRSRLGPMTVIGNGWDFSYNIRVQRRGNDVLLSDGSTREDLYRRQPGGTYVAPEFFREGMFAADDETFVLTFADLSTWSFRPLNSSLAPGMISAITDRHGNSLSFMYDALGRLSSVRDTLSRDIALSYGADGFLASVTDFTGRKVMYAYYSDADTDGSAGDLKSVTTPAVTGTPNGNDFPAGKTTTYTYSRGFADERLNHNLLTITDPKGQTWVRNTFASTTDPDDSNFDRLMSRELGDPGDVEALFFEEGVETGKEGSSGSRRGNRVIVNDRMGNVSEYDFVNDRCVRVRQYTGRAQRDQVTTDTTNRPTGKLRPTDPDWFETCFAHNADARCTKTVHPNGNVTRRFFEGDLNPLADARTRGNLRVVRRRPGSHTPVGDQSHLEETFEWASGFGACCGKEFVTEHVDPRGNVTMHAFDATGNRVQTIHRLPSIVEDFEYNAFGQLTAHTHPDNGGGIRRRDELHYYGVGNAQQGYLMDSVTDVAQLALTTTYEYDPVGNVTRIIDPRGNDKLFVVNQLNQIVRESSRLVTMFGGAAKARYRRDFSFDANDNLVQVDVLNVDEFGSVSANAQLTTTFAYDSLNFLINETKEVDVGQSVVTEYARDRNENLVLRRFGEASNGNQPTNTLGLRFDERDLVFQVIRAEGDPAQSTERRDYDPNGNLVRRHEGLEGQSRVTEHTFDAFGRRVATADPMGNREEVSFDANGNSVARRVLGELMDVPGDAGNVRLLEESTQFDVMDRPLQLVEEHFDPVTQAPIGDGQSIQTLWWTDASELLMGSDDNGNMTHFSYDPAHRLRERTDAKGNVTTYNRDENSNVTAVVDFEQSDTGLPPQTFVTSRFFDEEDRLVELMDNADNVTRFGYDSRDNRVRRVDALGNVRTTMFDGLGRRWMTTRYLTDDGTGNGNPIGQIVTTEMWDDSSRLVGRGDDHGNVLQHAYDPLNRVVAETHADGTVHSFVFDVHDNVVGRADANGTTVSSDFDLLNRRISSSITPGSGVSDDTTFELFGFDGLSRLVQAQDDDSIVMRGYDSLSNVVLDHLNGKKLTAEFDGQGNRLSCTYPGGRGFSCSFDALNRLSSISDSQALATWEYIGPERVERRTQPPVSLESRFTHDAVRRIVGIDHADVSGVPVDQRTYMWDAVHNKTESADVLAGGPQLAHDFSYDSAYRLGRTVVQGAFGVVRDTQYVHDDVNNRESVTGDPDCSGNYFLDPTLPAPGDFQTNQYTSTPCEDRMHDENGNLTRITVGGTPVSLTYDFRNQMVAYGSVATYAYDPLGRRIRKTVFDETGQETTTRYYYDGFRVCEERDDAGSVLHTFVYGVGLDELVQMQNKDDTYFCGDDQGSITKALQPGQGVVCQYTYGDYGKPSFFDGNGDPLPESATGNPYLFTGRRFDVETGLYYYRTRYLDPTAGRFTSRDTIGIHGDESNLGNGFAYVGNNPQSSVDPHGREAVKWLNYIDWGDDGSDVYVDFFDFHQNDYKIPGEDGRAGLWTDHGNPNPEGGATGEAPDLVSILEKLKDKVGGRWQDEQNLYSNPLGLILEDNGGLAPLVNPVPIDDLGREWEGEGGGGLGLNAGGLREYMERKKRQGKGKDDDDDVNDDGSGKPPDDARSGYYWDIGPSVLVNPHDHGLFRMVAPAQRVVFQ